MGNPTALRAFRAVQTSVCSSCRSVLQPQALSALRPFSHSSRALSSKDSTSKLLNNIDIAFRRASPEYSNLIPNSMVDLVQREWEKDDRHHMHIYSTKHNTHITLTKPNRDALISVSCGNIGFRKAGRGSYDAAYQLAAFVMSRIQDKGLLPQIRKLELIYRGFGPGREAVTKAILGSEGKKIRPLIVQLSDSTRLKFGGTRSKKPRRLG